MLGNERLARYIEQFGFGHRTGIELPGEARGLFRPASEWNETSIGSIPMGQEVGVTAVQAVAAYGCIANGGDYLKPHIVARITDAAGNVVEQPQIERHRVISQNTADTIKQMLEGVVMQGTGKAAQLGGYSAAGKTGTAQKIDEKTRRYSQTKYIASFAGFAPVENPQIACIVSIDEPVGAHHGGDVAAPVFARVVAQALRTLGVRPAGEPPSQIARDDTHVYDIGNVISEGQLASNVELPSSEPGLDVANDSQTTPVPPRGGAVMPDLLGLSIREALALCSARGLKIKPSGEGVVVLQTPSPGALVAQDAICIVKLSRQYVRKDATARAGGGR
jgi:membrane peptidoglycan carboxypeptidase